MKNQSHFIKALVCAFLLLGAAGCATIEGAGKDIETAGETVQDAADGE